MMLHIPARHIGALVMAAGLAVMLLPGLVLAHAELVTPSPADKSAVTEPVTDVTGIYSEAMTPNGSSLVVKDATGAVVANGTVDPADGTRMVATPATALATGTYAVEWTSVATDGHVDRGTWTFTVAIAQAPSPTPIPTVASSAQSTAAPTPVAVSPIPSIGPTPAPSTDGGTTGSGGDVILPIIVALIILGAGAAYLLGRRNRPTAPS